jgi:hypothetical protein
MALTITERPFLFSFSKNDIRYKLNVGNAAAGVAVEIELYKNATLISPFTLYPDSNGDIYCYVDDFLDSFLAPQLPELDGPVIQPVTDQFTSFYIRYRLTSDPAGQWSSDIANTRMAILGGVEQMKFKRNNFFVSYFDVNRPFLTWQPSGTRFVYQDEQHFLTCLSLLQVTGITVTVKTTFTDASESTKTINYVNADAAYLFRIKTGINDLELHIIDPTKTIHYYEVSVTDTTTGDIIANAYRFYVEYRPLYDSKDLFFFNSISGIDSARATGEFLWKVETKTEDVEHTVFYNTYNTKAPQAQYSQTNTTKRDTYIGDIGWSRSRAAQEALVEILVSKGRYTIIGDTWITLVNLKETVDLRLTTDKKWSFPVEFTFGYADRSFTPKNLRLGAGNAFDSFELIRWLNVLPELVGSEYYYHAIWENLNGVPAVILFETSTDGNTWSVLSGTRDNDTTYTYTFNNAATEAHYIRVTPSGGNAITFYYSRDYDDGFTATNITSNSFTITTGFSAGVSFDLSLDGGITFIQTGLTSTSYAVPGLTPATTYPVVRRMHSLNGVMQILPPVEVTTN